MEIKMKISKKKWPSTNEFEPIKDWLNEWDLQVCSDIQCRADTCTCGGNSYCHNVKYVHSLGTFHDPSSGIFRHQLTDWFGNQQDLVDYILENRDEIEEELRRECDL